MIGCVESRSLKNNTNRLEYFPKGFLSAIRAVCQRDVGEFLILVELDPALITPVRICWHPDTSSFPLGGDSNPPNALSQGCHYSCISM
jgi:hypothetical protein